MVKHIDNKNQSIESSFRVIKHCIGLYDSLVKTERNTWRVLPFVPRRFIKMFNVSIGWNYVLPHVWYQLPPVRCFANTYSLTFTNQNVYQCCILVDSWESTYSHESGNGL